MHSYLMLELLKILLSVVFKPNKVICSNKDAVAILGGIVDSELLLVVQILNDETHILEHAFDGCDTVAKVTIPDSVTHWELCHICFFWLQLFGRLDHPKLSDPHRELRLCSLQLFGELDHPQLCGAQ